MAEIVQKMSFDSKNYDLNYDFIFLCPIACKGFMSHKL